MLKLVNTQFIEKIPSGQTKSPSSALKGTVHEVTGFWVWGGFFVCFGLLLLLLFLWDFFVWFFVWVWGCCFFFLFVKDFVSLSMLKIEVVQKRLLF